MDDGAAGGQRQVFGVDGSEVRSGRLVHVFEYGLTVELLLHALDEPLPRVLALRIGLRKFAEGFAKLSVGRPNCRFDSGLDHRLLVSCRARRFTRSIRQTRAPGRDRQGNDAA